MTAPAPSLLRRLAPDRRGATIIEFALVLPVMLTVIMGLGELTYQQYVQAILTGAVQKAGRDSTIQGAAGQTSQIDATVMQMVRQVAKDATFDSKRSSYASFAAVAPEPFVDTAGTGTYVSTKDCFTDLNGNSSWDPDPGSTGQGGANDVTVYSIRIYYQRLFPVAALIGMSQTATLTGRTVLKNQPWAAQNAYAPKQICPK